MTTFTRDHPVTDHQRDFCEHEMSQCAGGCPPYGYCTSETHFRTAERSPDWPCPSALRALGETKAEWVAWEERLIEEHVAWMEQEMSR